MNNYRRFVSFIFISIVIQTLFGGNIPILKENYLNNNPACPKTGYQYWVEKEDNRYGNYEWKITGGYFIFENKNLTEISRPLVRGVTVVWNNVAAKDGKAPQGKITLKVYNKDQASAVIDNGELLQNIKSLNNILPFAPTSTSTALNYGVKTIMVTGTALVYTGLKDPNNNPLAVTKFEWKVPQGWTVVGGTMTASGTYTTWDYNVNIMTDYAGVGSVEYRGVNDCLGSEDYTAYSYPLAFTRTGLGLIEFPQTIIAGQSNTYNFSVTPMTGVGYEWQAPQGWSINGGGNTYYGTSNSVSIRNGICLTSEKVKVRYYPHSGTPDIWNEFSTTTIAPSINIPLGLKQHYTNTFSLNIPDVNINSVTWKINGIDAATVSNTSTAQFAISHSGKVKISAVLSLKGCDTPILIPAKEVDVQETIISISGPTQTCENSTITFSVVNPPVGFTWVCSGSLSLVSSSGNSATFSAGSTAGTASVSVKVGAVIAASKTITIGNASVSISGPDFILTGSNGQYAPEASCILAGPYTWKLINSNDVLDIQTITTERPRLSVLSKSGGVQGSLAAYRLVLSVGGLEHSKHINGAYGQKFVFNSSGPIIQPDFSIYPNPATDLLTVERTTSETEENAIMLSRTTNTMATPYTIQLWNGTQGLIRTVEGTKRVQQVSLQGLPKGMYFVHLIVGEQTVQRKILFVN